MGSELVDEVPSEREPLSAYATVLVLLMEAPLLPFRIIEARVPEELEFMWVGRLHVTDPVARVRLRTSDLDVTRAHCSNEVHVRHLPVLARYPSHDLVRDVHDVLVRRTIG